MNRVFYRYRVYFSKSDQARFIGHLDLQSLFQKAFKRAKLPVAYSEGFNPHQLLSFAAPLPLGTAGKGEILDVHLVSKMETGDIRDRLNLQMPAGIVMLFAEEITSTNKSTAALVTSATYRIVFPPNPEVEMRLENVVGNILGAEVIEVKKKTKKGFAVTDIRQDILSLKNVSKVDETALEATLSTGSTRNLKPEILVGYILDTMDIDIDNIHIFYERTAIHADGGTT